MDEYGIRSNTQPSMDNIHINQDINTESNINQMDRSLQINSSGVSCVEHRNLVPDEQTQMPRDGSVYTIANTNNVIHGQIQNDMTNIITSYSYNAHNTRQYPVYVLSPDARVQPDSFNSTQVGNQTVRPETPPPTYEDYISGATSATFV